MKKAPRLEEDLSTTGYKDKFYIDRLKPDTCYSILRIVSATETEEKFTRGETLIWGQTYNLLGDTKKEFELLRLSEHLQDIRVTWDLNPKRHPSDIPE